MNVRARKWGNSLAIRIPRSVALSAKVIEGTSLDVKSTPDGRIILLPRRRGKVTLKELLAGVTPENVHGETDWGGPVGKEIW